jgi:nitrite reductase/ring-hydroxylating ferredoxin subunit
MYVAAGNVYAINARCPHLNLPMKKGKIAMDETTGVPVLTCSFHNSKFRLDNGTLRTLFET